MIAIKTTMSLEKLFPKIIEAFEYEKNETPCWNYNNRR